MSSVVTLEGKNVTNLVMQMKQGIDPRLSDIQNDSFTDVVLSDGTQLQNITFDEFQALVVTLEPKNVVSISYEQKN
jgi:hypothetical protein